MNVKGAGSGSSSSEQAAASTCRPTSTRVHAPSPPASPPATAEITKPCRVLIVDDNEDVVEVLAMALQTAGFETESAFDGPAALRLARSFFPHVALLDIGLPVMDGYELAGKLRCDYGPSLRLVAITGYGEESDRARSFEAGFDEHLTKPVDVRKLIEVLRMS